MSPTVSVVVPVHDCLPYLEDALASVFHQTLPREQVEVIAVDDGSTDGSGEALARWAEQWPQLRVITQAPSGSAARPRNVGLDNARGEYVFFLDGDDCLGPEALERLLDMARHHDSDVVYARLVGVRRTVPEHVFVKDVGRAELTSGIYQSLAPFKLFRRALLVEHGIRFPEHLRIMEDQPFVAAALLAARTISVLASYPCYYLVRRSDGSNLSAQGLPLADVLRQTQDVVDLVRARTAPGEVRDHLLARHVSAELVDKFRHMDTWPADQQRHRVALAAPYARDWFDPRMDPLLDLADRLLVRAIASNDADAVEQIVRWRTHGGRAPIVERDGEWFLAGPGFDDPDGPPRSAFAMAGPYLPRAQIERASVTDGHLELLGSAWLPGESSATVEPSAALVHLETGEEHALTTTRTPTPYLNAVMGAPSLDFSTAGIRLEGDFTATTLRPGHWGVLVRLRSVQRSEEIRPVPTDDMKATAFSAWTDHEGASVRGRVGVGTRGFVVVVLEPAGDERLPEQPSPDRPSRGARWRRRPAGSDR